MSNRPTIPDPALVVLVGSSGSGKSTWATTHFRAQEVVSSDALRAVVGSGEHDLEASADAFKLLETIVEARVRRRLTTVVDTLGMDALQRRRYLDLAKSASLPAVLVVFDTAAAECRRRNRSRDQPVPAAVIEAQFARMRHVTPTLDEEGWDVIARVGSELDLLVVEPTHSRGAREAAAAQAARPTELSFVLQISRFPWADDPTGWLSDLLDAAADAGFAGIALMDHLIQIPQVGRAWDPLPEPVVTLGLLAGLLARRATTLTLGTLVTPVTFRPAGVLAKSIATLDALTGGRTFCGVGAGWWEREHAAYGVPFPPVSRRMDDLETTIETMRALWGPGTKAYSGRRVHLPETTCYPRPAGSIPIIVGGGGERRTLRIAAELGDGCNVSADLDTLDRKLTVLRRHCAELGRDPADVEVTVLDLPLLGGSRDEVAATVERLRGRAKAASFAARHHAGTATDHIGRYRLLAQRGVSTVFVSPPDLAGPAEVSRFTPVIAAFR